MTYTRNLCECCHKPDREAFPYDITEKGIHYNFLCNICFRELGGWSDYFEEVTPEQLDMIADLINRQFEKDGQPDAVVFSEGLRHYALRQIIYYYEYVMANPEEE